MHPKTMILVRGLSGSGKTTIARRLVGEDPCAYMRSNDDYLYLKREGDYQMMDGKPLYEQPFLMDLYQERKDPTYYKRNICYEWSSARLKYAIAWCLWEVERLVRDDKCGTIIVHNTFDRRWTMQPYLDLAQRMRAVQQEVHVTVMDLFTNGLALTSLQARSEHSVPYETIKRMHDRWDHDWNGVAAFRN